MVSTKSGSSLDAGQFTDVTEMAGQPVSSEQLDRTCHRYYWAAGLVRGKDVAEVACGAGPGLSLLAKHVKSLKAGDISQSLLDQARAVYGDRFQLEAFDAAHMPYAAASLDAILLFEAIYYLPDVNQFLQECRRVLRPGGAVLIATANKDLFDFTPSPYSRTYFGARELADICKANGYAPSLWGYLDTTTVSMRQRLLRPLKFLASRLNLIPKTMTGKAWLKRLYFGEMQTMPGSIADVPFVYKEPLALDPNVPDTRHKVIYCAAHL